MSSYQHNEDAAAYRINNKIAIIFTTDFITPIVDDPFTFGQIAAANALSDIFAMGGKPLLALNIVCFPADRLLDLEKIIKGGWEKVQEAGAILVGGHSIKDREPKYGLAVLGLVHPKHIIRNNNCQERDRLILTKPLGTGIISTALKSEEISIKEAQEAINWMVKLNNVSENILSLSINSMTDVTGFGFLGHLSEMLQDSDLGADIEVNNIPLYQKALELSHKDIVPGGSRLNQKTFSCYVEKRINIDLAKEMLLYDAQTSGGLLMAIKEKDAELALTYLFKEGFTESRIVGSIRKINSQERMIRLK